jgi:hypothetical protein
MYVAKGRQKSGKKQNTKQANKQKQQQNTEHNKRKRTGCTKCKGWYLLNT